MKKVCLSLVSVFILVILSGYSGLASGSSTIKPHTENLTNNPSGETFTDNENEGSVPQMTISEKPSVASATSLVSVTSSSKPNTENSNKDKIDSLQTISVKPAAASATSLTSGTFTSKADTKNTSYNVVNASEETLYGEGINGPLSSETKFTLPVKSEPTKTSNQYTTQSLPYKTTSTKKHNFQSIPTTKRTAVSEKPTVVSATSLASGTSTIKSNKENPNKDKIDSLQTTISVKPAVVSASSHTTLETSTHANSSTNPPPQTTTTTNTAVTINTSVWILSVGFLLKLF